MFALGCVCIVLVCTGRCDLPSNEPKLWVLLLIVFFGNILLSLQGYALIEYENYEDAEKAIQGLVWSWEGLLSIYFDG